MSSAFLRLTQDTFQTLLPPPDRSPEEEAERAACLADPSYFITTYCQIKSDTGAGLLPFHLYDYQRDLLATFQAHREVIVLKARQLGITELIAAYAVWFLLRPHQTVIVLSQGEKEANELLAKAELAWSHLPEFLRVAKANPSKSSTLELVNGSRMLPMPATKKAGRTFNAQLLIFDEWAHQEQQEALYAAAAPTALSAGNQLIGISTANGAGNFYARQWQLAQDGEGAHPVFLPWHARPGRDQAWYDHATRGYEEWLKAQEYPASPEEAFALSGRPRFDHRALADIAAGCSAPTKTIQLGTQSDGKPAGQVRYWAPPESGHRYVCGADTAEGLPKGDYSAAILLDYESGVEVAELHGHWPPEVFATHLAKLCTLYHHAYLGVERNNHGHAVLLALAKLEHYAPLYHHREYDKRGGGGVILGWQTSSKSKPIMIDALAQAITERRPYRNARFVAEARTYTITDTGDTEASGSLHDDRVVAYAIAEQVRKRPWPEQAIPIDPGIVGKSKWR